MFSIPSWKGRPKRVTGPSGYCIRKFAAMVSRFIYTYQIFIIMREKTH